MDGSLPDEQTAFKNRPVLGNAALKVLGVAVLVAVALYYIALFPGLPEAWRKAQEMCPDMYCQIHPDRAKERGIEDGDKVRVATSHGSVEAVAWITNGIRDHAVFLPIGWDERQPFHPWKAVNFLTDRTQRDPVSEQTNLKSLLCRVDHA